MRSKFEAREKLKKPFYLEEVSRVQSSKVLLCVHGLNQNPSSLKPLLRDIEKFEYKTYLLHLPGHRALSSAEDSLSSHDFSNSIVNAANYIAQFNSGPIDLLGYSFGGLLGVLNADRVPFKKIILLAPALRLRPYTHVLRAVLPFVAKVRSLPLSDPKLDQRYRFHLNGVPKEIYQSFFEIYSNFQKKDKSYLSQQDGIVMAHPRDELVSFHSLNLWVSNHTAWSTVALDNSQAPFRGYNHLCFDHHTLGEQSYQNLVFKVKNFLIDSH